MCFIIKFIMEDEIRVLILSTICRVSYSRLCVGLSDSNHSCMAFPVREFVWLVLEYGNYLIIVGDSEDDTLVVKVLEGRVNKVLAHWFETYIK